MNIITKFTVATEQGIEALLTLTKTLAVQKFAQLLKPVELERYIIENFNAQTLVSEINSMSNQWLVVYVDDQPIGYARITSKGKKPIAVEGKRAIRVADFGICQHQAQQQIMTSLIDKCLTVCSTYEAIWINEPVGSSFTGLFEQKGFIRQPEMSRFDELPLESAIYLKINL